MFAIHGQTLLLCSISGYWCGLTPPVICSISGGLRFFKSIFHFLSYYSYPNSTCSSVFLSYHIRRDVPDYAMVPFQTHGKIPFLFWFFHSHLLPPPVSHTPWARAHSRYAIHFALPYDPRPPPDTRHRPVCRRHLIFPWESLLGSGEWSPRRREALHFFAMSACHGDEAACETTEEVEEIKYRDSAPLMVAWGET